MKTSKKELLIFHHGLKEKDGFSRCFNLARYIAGREWNVVIITSQKEKVLYTSEIRCLIRIIAFYEILPYKFIKGGFGFFSLIFKVFYSVSHRSNIVMSTGHRPSSFFPSFINKIRFNSKYYSEWWDLFGKGGYFDNLSAINKLLYGFIDCYFEVFDKKYADKVIVLSKYLGEKAINSGVNKNNVIYLHGGADTENIEYFPNSNYKAKLGFPLNSLTFALIGMNEEELDELIPFIKSVNELKKSIRVNWFSIGLKLSNSTKSKYCLGKEYKDLGWIDYSKQSVVLSGADVFLLLRRSNEINSAGWPNKLGDYLAAGRPVLTNGTGDVEEYITKYPEAFIKINYEADDIKRAINNLYIDRENLVNAGKYSRYIAERELSWKTKSVKLVSVFEKQLLDEKE